MDRALRDLIRRMSRENPLLGAPRIHGELLMLGFDVAQSTVSKYLVRGRTPPSQSWKTFLRNHANAIAAIDLCVVPSLTFERLFALLVLGHGRRQLLWFGVTRHPTAEWLARQITETFPWEAAPRYLIRDNDGAYGQVFVRRLRAMGIRDRPISPSSPWQNGYVERLIGSVRDECLDHVLVFGEAHLKRILATYAAYYNRVRRHLALDKNVPLGRAIQRSGSIVAIPVLGGLHYQYVRDFFFGAARFLAAALFATFFFAGEVAVAPSPASALAPLRALASIAVATLSKTTLAAAVEAAFTVAPAVAAVLATSPASTLVLLAALFPAATTVSRAFVMVPLLFISAPSSLSRGRTSARTLY